MTGLAGHTAGRTEWHGAGPHHDRDWMVVLTGDQRRQLIADTTRLWDAGETLGTAPASAMRGSVLDAAAEQVDDLLGRCGVALVDGFPLDDLGDHASLAFWCFGALLGDPLPQSPRGRRIDLVRDERLATVRGSKTDRDLIFHTDFAATEPDRFGLLVVRQAASGGETLLASAPAVHRELRRAHGDALATLYEDFWFDRTSDAGSGESPPVRLPVFHRRDGRPVVRYNRARIHRGHRFAGEPLTGRQIAAMDALDSVLADPRFVVRTTVRRGQALFIDNAAVLHGRTAFSDGDGAVPGRLLLRVWLRDVAN
jgi:alpha-ketoglutarate-dependent taurine dioxygenase